MTPDFLLTALVVCLLPGTGVIYTLAIGVGLGWRAGLAAALGWTLGIVPAALASILGLAAILHASAVAFQVVKGLGVLYLLWMAWSVLRERGVLAFDGDRRARGPLGIVRDGILLNVLNPKLTIFFLAFLPQFVPMGSAHPTAALTGLAGVFMAMTFVVFAGYGGAAALARDHVISCPAVAAWLRRGFAATFGLLGLRLAFADC